MSDCVCAVGAWYCTVGVRDPGCMLLTYTATHSSPCSSCCMVRPQAFGLWNDWGFGNHLRNQCKCFLAYMWGMISPKFTPNVDAMECRTAEPTTFVYLHFLPCVHEPDTGDILHALNVTQVFATDVVPWFSNIAHIWWGVKLASHMKFGLVLFLCCKLPTMVFSMQHQILHRTTLRTIATIIHVLDFMTGIEPPNSMMQTYLVDDMRRLWTMNNEWRWIDTPPAEQAIWFSAIMYELFCA